MADYDMRPKWPPGEPLGEAAKSLEPITGPVESKIVYGPELKFAHEMAMRSITRFTIEKPTRRSRRRGKRP